MHYDDHDTATAADLARIYRVTTGTIYGWASKDHWRRWHWPRRYSREDAQASYDRRHPPKSLTPPPTCREDPDQYSASTTPTSPVRQPGPVPL